MKKTWILMAAVWAWACLPLRAQDNLPYKMPPKAIADLADAPLTPTVRVDSKGEWMLLLQRSDMPTIADLAQPELRLAGLRINPAINGPSRAAYFTGMKLRKLAGGPEITVNGLPERTLMANLVWSPDERKVAFSVTKPNGMELWVADIATATAQRVGNFALNAAYTSPLRWMPDGQHLLCAAIVPNRGTVPAQATVPGGPVVQENLGKKAPSRTYQDLLRNPADEALFEYYCTSQIMKVSLDGTATPIGKPGLVQGISTSPNGEYVMLRTTHRPYSYLVTAGRFPVSVDIYQTNGTFVKQFADLPLQENLPTGFDAVPTGPRSITWRDDAPATLCWAEAQDGGDPKKETAVRDKVFTLDAPFNGTPQELLTTTYRFQGIAWGNAQVALVYEGWWANRKELVRVLNPTTRSAKRVLFDRSSEDRYTAPGSPLTKANQYGRDVLAFAKDGSLYMSGQGASPEGDRPFVDMLNLETQKSTRLWRSEAPYYETLVAMIDYEKQVMLTLRESQTENPNYFLRDLKKKKISPVTSFPHPYPQLKGVSKQLLKYRRPDGVELSATLYLPANYKKEDGPLPTFLWAYPEEFKTKAAAGQVTGSPHRFTRLSWGSPIYWVAQGYAILDNASIPIVGEEKTEPNDTFVEQLVASAKAAIDEGVRLGVVDAQRVGVGGHSYGAFMTANLLAHSDLFKAGIARSGAYNRTLTPFGFQSEERTYWEAPDVYNRMSPFMNADKLKEPILLIHGEADNNPGTFPLQSERFYNALKGHGATTRFVLLPHESHGYAARESIMHMLWEMNEWLERYVKNASKAN